MSGDWQIGGSMAAMLTCGWLASCGSSSQPAAISSGSGDAADDLSQRDDAATAVEGGSNVDASTNDIDSGLAGLMHTRSVPGHVVSSGRASMSLDGRWRFLGDPDNRGEASGYAEPAFDDAAWRSIVVPGSWNLLDEFAEYEGKGWYRQAFDTPAQVNGVARLHFDAAYYDVRVWLNGQLLGGHTGGYTPFEFDVTGKLAPPGSHNVVVVSADNSYNVGAWYFWGGLSRSVRLEIDNPVRIEHQKVVARPDLVAGTAAISTVVTISNVSSKDQSVKVSGSLEDGDGKTLASFAAGAAVTTLAAGATADVALSATLDKGAYDLWDIDHPTLYRSRVRVLDDGANAYEMSDAFGIRKIEVKGAQFLLNGEPVRLVGYNRVPDDRVSANSEPTFLVRRDLDRMKAAGANVMRIFHTPQSPELLDYADRIGLLLTCEVPVWGSGANLAPTNLQPEHELDEMIHRDVNHPSIFAWSVANEIASTTQLGRDFVKAHIDYVRAQLDDSRFMTFASNQYGGATAATEALQYTDFTGGNSYGSFAQQADKLNALYPDRPALMTEFSPDGYTFDVLRETLEHATGVGTTLRLFDPKPWLFGASVWSYNDYRSNYAGTSTNHARGWGVQDMWGGLKKGYFQAQTAFAPIARLSLTSGNEAGSDRTSAIDITPRGLPATSIPSFTLRGYHLLWQAIDKDGKIVGGKIFDLDAIAPGGAAVHVPVTWSTGGQIVVEEQASLLNPTGHEVAVTRAALAPPAATAIDQIIVGDGAARVLFHRVPGATQYRLEATAGATTLTESVEYTPGIFLGGLTNGTTYSFKVVAANSRGEIASPVMSAMPIATGGPVSPRLQALVPIEGGFVLGFIVSAATESGWEVEIVDAATQAAVATYRTTVVAVTRYEKLEGNHDYRVRLRKNDAGGTSAWSEWLDVHTLGNGARPSLDVRGVLVGPRSIGVRIVPSARAERYLVVAKPSATGGSVVSRIIERSAVDVLVVDGLASATAYAVSVEAQADGTTSISQTLSASTTPAQ